MRPPLPPKCDTENAGYLVGTGGDRLKALEEEYECSIIITGQGSGSRDPKLPGYHLPHLLVTMTGTDVRSLGRLRLSIEHRLIDYVIENSPQGNVIGGGGHRRRTRRDDHQEAPPFTRPIALQPRHIRHGCVPQFQGQTAGSHRPRPLADAAFAQRTHAQRGGGREQR